MNITIESIEYDDTIKFLFHSGLIQSKYKDMLYINSKLLLLLIDKDLVTRLNGNYIDNDYLLSNLMNQPDNKMPHQMIKISQYGDSFLYQAFNEDIFRFLLQEGMNPLSSSCRCPHTGYLHHSRWLIGSTSLNTMYELIKRCVDPTIMKYHDPIEPTRIRYRIHDYYSDKTCIEHNINIVKQFIEYKCDPTFILLSPYELSDDIKQYLLDANADPKQREIISYIDIKPDTYYYPSYHHLSTDISIKEEREDDISMSCHHHGVTLEKLKTYVSSNQLVDKQDKYVKTLLHYAIESYSHHQRTLGCDNSGNYNSGENNGENPSLAMVQYLLNSKASLEKRDHGGHCPIHIAARLSDPLIIRCLIEANADIHAKDNLEWTPLYHAAHVNAPNFGFLYHTYNLSLNKTTSYGISPIHLAAHNNPDVLNLILSTLSSSSTSTPSCNDNIKMVYLKDTDHIKDTDLLSQCLSISSQSNIASSLLLIEYNTNVNTIPSSSFTKATPLHHAASRLPELIPYLLESNASLISRDDCGAYPIHYATKYHNTYSLQLLINAKASIHVKDDDEPNHDGDSNNIAFDQRHLNTISGLSPLHYAARYNYNNFIYIYNLLEPHTYLYHIFNKYFYDRIILESSCYTYAIHYIYTSQLFKRPCIDKTQNNCTMLFNLTRSPYLKLLIQYNPYIFALLLRDIIKLSYNMMISSNTNQSLLSKHQQDSLTQQLISLDYYITGTDYSDLLKESSQYNIYSYYILLSISKHIWNNINIETFHDSTYFRELIQSIYHNAAISGNYDIIQYNINQNYNVKPLISSVVAAAGKSAPCLKLLVEANGDINAESDRYSYHTPLLKAISSRNIDSILYLTKNPNIDVNKPNIFNITPLLCSISQPNSLYIVQLLTRLNANIDRYDYKILSARYDHNTMSYLMTNYNIDFSSNDISRSNDLSNSNRPYPIQYAAQDNPFSLKVLLDTLPYSSILSYNKYKQTPLHLAAQTEYHQSVYNIIQTALLLYPPSTSSSSRPLPPSSSSPSRPSASSSSLPNINIDTSTLPNVNIDRSTGTSTKPSSIDHITYINIQDNDNRTALHYASQCKTTSQSVYILLQYNADIYIRDYNNKTALHYAAQYNSDSVKLILAIDPLFADDLDDIHHNHNKTGSIPNHNYTPLLIAIENENYNAIFPLLKSYQDPLKIMGDQGDSIFHILAKIGHFEYISYVFSRYAKAPELSFLAMMETMMEIYNNMSGNTTHIIVTHDDIPILSSSSSSSSSLSSDNLMLSSLLQLSSSLLSHFTQEALDMIRIKLNTLNRYKQYCINLIKDCNTDILSLFLIFKADPIVSSPFSMDAIHIAAQCNKTKSIELLLHYKVDINVVSTNNDGYTPLFYAIKYNNTECLNLLINMNAGIYNQYGDGQNNSLHIASMYNYKCINRLLAANVDHVCYNKEGYASYHYITRYQPLGIHDMIKYNTNINIYHKNTDETPLHHISLQSLIILQQYKDIIQFNNNNKNNNNNDKYKHPIYYNLNNINKCISILDICGIDNAYILYNNLPLYEYTSCISIYILLLQLMVPYCNIKKSTLKSIFNFGGYEYGICYDTTQHKISDYNDIDNTLLSDYIGQIL